MAYASRQSSYLIASFGAFLQVTAGWLGGHSVSSSGIENAWNPAHLILYSGVAIAAFGAWQGLRIRRDQQAVAVSPFRFVNIAGLKLTGLGCLIEIVAVTWSNLAPCILGCEGGYGPAHGLLTLGMLTANFGVVLGLTIEYEMIRRDFIIVSTVTRDAVSIFILLTFSAIWLAASGELIHLGDALRSSLASWVIAFFLSLFGTFVLVPLKRVIPRIGSGLGVSVFFNVVAYMGLVPYEGSHPYLPWGILPIILFELALWRLDSTIGFKNAALVSSLLLGVLFGEVYYPFTVYLFPWSFSLQPQLLSPLVGSVAGAYLGNRVYSALSSAMLSNVTASL